MLDDVRLTLVYDISLESDLFIALLETSCAYCREMRVASAALEYDLGFRHELLEVVDLELVERETAEVEMLDVRICLESFENADVVCLF